MDLVSCCLSFVGGRVYCNSNSAGVKRRGGIPMKTTRLGDDWGSHAIQTAAGILMRNGVVTGQRTKFPICLGETKGMAEGVIHGNAVRKGGETSRGEVFLIMPRVCWSNPAFSASWFQESQFLSQIPLHGQCTSNCRCTANVLPTATAAEKRNQELASEVYHCDR